MRILLIFSILAVVLTTAAQQQQRRRSLMGSASPAAPATPDFTFITNAVGSATDGINADTPARDTTGANLIVIWVSSYGGSVSAIHDFTNGVDTGTSASYVSLTNVASPAAQEIQAFFLTNVVTGTSHTFRVTAGGAYFPSAVMQAFAVAGGAVPTLDAQSGNLSGSATSNQPGSRTPSQDKCLVVSGNEHTVVEDMSVTQLGSLIQTNYSPGFSIGLGAAHEIQTSAAARNPTWSWATADVTACAQAIFKK